MKDVDIDVNLLVQTMNEKISQLTQENLFKDAIIKQLTGMLSAEDEEKEEK